MWPFFRRGPRGRFTYKFWSRNRTASATVAVAWCRGRTGTSRRYSPARPGSTGGPAVALAYRRRFGIETSYRQFGECLAGATSRDAVYRLLVGVSLLTRA